MKTIIKLTLAAALATGTFQTFAQDDALAQLRARRAQEQQQLSGQTADAAPAATPAATPDATAQTPPVASDAAAQPNDPLAALKARRAQELLGAGGGSQPAGNTSYVPAPATVALDSQPPMDATPSDYTPAALSTNGITFNFRNAPLSDVLAYMSDAAGFTILLNVQVNSRVTVISTHPMSKDKAVDVLNSVLNQNGLAAISGDNDVLTIMNKSDAIHLDIPVKQGNDWTNIPKNAEIVTQIIPIRFVDAQQLVVDISAFVSPQAIIVANQSGNSIIVTDTQSNIRHLTQIIHSIDSSAEMETEVHVFALKHASPNDVVAMLAGVFPSGAGGATTTVAGGRGGGLAALFGGGGGGRGGGGANSSQSRVQKAQQVLAVADGRTQSVIVTAAKGMMPQIEQMINEVDVISPRDGNVATITLKNGDPYEVANVLQTMFGGTTQQRGQTTTSPLKTRETQNFNTTSGSSSGLGGTSGGGYTTP